MSESIRRNPVMEREEGRPDSRRGAGNEAGKGWRKRRRRRRRVY